MRLSDKACSNANMRNRLKDPKHMAKVKIKLSALTGIVGNAQEASTKKPLKDVGKEMVDLA